MHGIPSNFSISITKKKPQWAKCDKQCGKRHSQMCALEKSLVSTKQR